MAMRPTLWVFILAGFGKPAGTSLPVRSVGAANRQMSRSFGKLWILDCDFSAGLIIGFDVQGRLRQSSRFGDDALDSALVPGICRSSAGDDGHVGLFWPITDVLFHRLASMESKELMRHVMTASSRWSVQEKLHQFCL